MHWVGKKVVRWVDCSVVGMVDLFAGVEAMRMGLCRSNNRSDG